MVINKKGAHFRLSAMQRLEQQVYCAFGKYYDFTLFHSGHFEISIICRQVLAEHILRSQGKGSTLCEKDGKET
jgi:hypothetical protein